MKTSLSHNCHLSDILQTPSLEWTFYFHSITGLLLFIVWFSFKSINPQYTFSLPHIYTSFLLQTPSRCFPKIPVWFCPTEWGDHDPFYFSFEWKHSRKKSCSTVYSAVKESSKGSTRIANTWVILSQWLKVLPNVCPPLAEQSWACQNPQAHVPFWRMQNKIQINKTEVVHQFFLWGNKCIFKLLILVLSQSMWHVNVFPLNRWLCVQPAGNGHSGEHRLTEYLRIMKWLEFGSFCSIFQHTFPLST